MVGFRFDLCNGFAVLIDLCFELYSVGLFSFTTDAEDCSLKLKPIFVNCGLEFFGKFDCARLLLLTVSEHVWVVSGLADGCAVLGAIITGVFLSL